ncbi:hypothetical protein XENTR_v10022639 [Xenopus tropicalis]|nr:hypothetical protein XENTR_v10022639 [Xenopus tropicalis]
MNPDSTGLDQVIITYMDNSVVPKGPSELMRRLSFSATDPSKGDASITITYLEPSDSRTLQCKVKKNPGVASRKVSLIVQVPPTHPNCWIDGEQVKGKDVTLKCQANGATTPLSYKWEKIAGPTNPATPPLNMATANGDLLIKNISDPYAGQYRCTVVNSVGSGQCVALLSVSAASNRAGIIAGAVIGALLLLLLLLLLIWCLICCCNKKRYEKEMANDIKEDVVAPPSNSNSRSASVRTAAGYTPHNISYSLRKAYSATPTKDIKTPSETSSNPVKPRIESAPPTPEPVLIVPESSRTTPYNLQRVGGVPVMVPATSWEGFIV